MKRIKVPVEDELVGISASYRNGCWSIVGFGHTTSVRSLHCSHEAMLRDFACVLLFACNLEDTEQNIESITTAVTSLCQDDGNG